MSRHLLNRYIWILETIERYGRISRQELDMLWREADVSGGEPLARRTFYNYRNGIEELLGITIGYNPSTFEYFIENSDNTSEFNGWLVNSMSINGMLSSASEIADCVMLEEVPSARQHLSSVIDAIKSLRKIRFTYTPFYRQNPTEGIVIAPYFLRIFRQRWYVIGYNDKDRKIKTYSLDRLSDITITEETYEKPEIGVKEFFKNAFGIMTSMSEAKTVTIKADSEQSKYFRALPLHPSQQEQLCDGYSIFSYHLYITYDLVQELLSYGHRITVIAPVELRAIIVDELRNSLDNYN